ncbi:MAG: hypothetical protein ACOY93_13680 [Bacillota bacterium]
MYRSQSLLTTWRTRLGAQDGYVMVAAVFTVFLVMISGLAVLGRANTEQRLSRRQVELEQAGYAAMAGVEACMGYIMYDAASNTKLEMPDPDNPPTHNICADITTNTVGNSSYTVEAYYLNKDAIEVVANGRSLTNTAITRVAKARLGVPDGGPNQKGLADIEAQSIAWGSGEFRINSNGIFVGNIFVKGTIFTSGNPTFCGNFYATETAGEGGSVGSMDPAATWPAPCPYSFDATETETVGDTRTYALHSNQPMIEIPPFEFEGGLEVELNNGDGFTPKCPPDELYANLPWYCKGPTGNEVMLVKVPGHLYMDQYKPVIGKPVDKFQLYGNLIYLVEGNIFFNGVDMLYGYTSTADGTHKSRIQFVTMDGDVTIQGDNSGIAANGSRQVLGTIVAPSKDPARGKVWTKNVYLEGMVFANYWETNGPTDHLATGRVWVTNWDWYDNVIKLPQDEDGDGVVDQSDPDGWTIDGFWHG